jgi:hypothetical protein
MSPDYARFDRLPAGTRWRVMVAAAERRNAPQASADVFLAALQQKSGFSRSREEKPLAEKGTALRT